METPSWELLGIVELQKITVAFRNEELRSSRQLWKLTNRETKSHLREDIPEPVLGKRAPVHQCHPLWLPTGEARRQRTALKGHRVQTEQDQRDTFSKDAITRGKMLTSQ